MFHVKKKPVMFEKKSLLNTIWIFNSIENAHAVIFSSVLCSISVTLTAN